jgi:hypothetical protein
VTVQVCRDSRIYAGTQPGAHTLHWVHGGRGNSGLQFYSCSGTTQAELDRRLGRASPQLRAECSCRRQHPAWAADAKGEDSVRSLPTALWNPYQVGVT